MPVSADIRRFLTESFSDEEITTLCFDRFRPVYDTFAGGMTKGQKIQILIEYCERHDEWPVLLSALQRERPRQFAALLETEAPEITRSVPISKEGEPRSRSGGIDLNAHDVSIGGDAVGRDKFITINGNVYIIHVGNATDPSSVRRAIDAEPPAASAHPHVENPFYTNGRINDPALFFDRERLVREIRSELSKRSSVSLVGESQVGKSSLLYYLYATRADWLPDVAIEYIDLQRVFSEADFCKAVLKRIGVEGNSLQDLRDALETREVILLLDEVERIAEAGLQPAPARFAAQPDAGEKLRVVRGDAAPAGRSVSAACAQRPLALLQCLHAQDHRAFHRSRSAPLFDAALAGNQCDFHRARNHPFDC